MTLKTLKDLYGLPSEQDFDLGDELTINNLKKVAREWIKILENHENNEWNLLPQFVFDDRSHEAIVLWIKHFFNIESEVTSSDSAKEDEELK